MRESGCVSQEIGRLGDISIIRKYTKKIPVIYPEFIRIPIAKISTKISRFEHNATADATDQTRIIRDNPLVSVIIRG